MEVDLTMKYTVINSDINNGMKYIEALDNYNLIIGTDIDTLMRNSKKCDYLIFLTKEQNDFMVQTAFITQRVECIKMKGIFMYIICDKHSSKLRNKRMLDMLHENSHEDNLLNLFSIDTRYYFLISKLLNNFNSSNINILDLSDNEQISLSIIKYNTIYGKASMTRINKITYRTEMALKMTNQKISKIEIFQVKVLILFLVAYII